jgi:hypothetical protein
MGHAFPTGVWRVVKKESTLLTGQGLEVQFLSPTEMSSADHIDSLSLREL